MLCLVMRHLNVLNSQILELFSRSQRAEIQQHKPDWIQWIILKLCECDICSFSSLPWRLVVFRWGSGRVRY